MAQNVLTRVPFAAAPIATAKPVMMKAETEMKYMYESASGLFYKGWKKTLVTDKDEITKHMRSTEIATIRRSVLKSVPKI